MHEIAAHETAQTRRRKRQRRRRRLFARSRRGRYRNGRVPHATRNQGWEPRRGEASGSIWLRNRGVSSARGRGDGPNRRDGVSVGTLRRGFGGRFGGLGGEDSDSRGGEGGAREGYRVLRLDGRKP